MSRLSFHAAALLAAALLAGCAGGRVPSAAGVPQETPAQKLYREGQLAVQRGNLAEAMEKFQAARATAEKEGSREGLASSLHAIALIHAQEGRLRQALEPMNRVLALDRRALGEAKRGGAAEATLHALEAKVAADLYDLARIHRKMGDANSTLRRLLEALGIDERLGREQGAAITHNNIGRLLLALDRPDEAQAHYKAALAAFEKLEDEARAKEVRANLEFLETVRRSRRPARAPAR